MHRSLLKTISVVLILSLALSVAGCSGKKVREAEIISEDEEWFSSTELILKNDSPVVTWYSNPIVVTPGRTVLAGADNPDTGERTDDLLIYTGDELTGSIDIKDYRQYSDSWIYCGFDMGTTNGNTDFVCITENWRDKNLATIYTIDYENLELIDPINVEYEYGDDNYSEIAGIKANGECIYVCYDYHIGYDTLTGFEVYTTSGEKIADIATGKSIYSNWSVDNNGIIWGVTYDFDLDRETVVTKIDAVNGTVEEVDSPNYPGGTKVLSSGNFLNNGCVYFTCSDYSIEEYNFATGELSTIVHANNIDVNLATLNFSEVRYSDGTDIVIGQGGLYSGEDVNKFELNVLHREDVNPHAGKKILTVASRIYSFMEGEAIRLFNRQNDEYHMYITNKYDIESLKENSGVVIESYLDSSELELNALRQDIIAGVGPDIILNYGGTTNLNSQDMLLNLLPVLDELDRSLYFDNFFDAYTLNDSLYQVPLSVGVSGLYGRVGNLPEGTKGFTFDEYDSYMQSELNGKNPIDLYMGRSGFITDTIKSIYTDMVNSDGTINLDIPEFRNAMEYALTLPHEDFAATEFNPAERARPETFYNIYSDTFNMTVKHSGFDMFGMPSSDGRGPMAYMSDSVAITTCSVSQEACMDFVRTILSYDIQKLCFDNPINRQAFEEYAAGAAQVANDNISRYMGIDDYYDDTLVDIYRNYIESAESPMIYDPSLLKIINEETPSYFDGQKSLDDVIEIIENRYNNMVEESR